MANVKDNTRDGEKRNDFERASSHLLPKDSVVKKEKNTVQKRPQA